MHGSDNYLSQNDTEIKASATCRAAVIGPKTCYWHHGRLRYDSSFTAENSLHAPICYSALVNACVQAS